jgi:hypothetical protein
MHSNYCKSAVTPIMVMGYRGVLLKGVNESTKAMDRDDVMLMGMTGDDGAECFRVTRQRRRGYMALTLT